MDDSNKRRENDGAAISPKRLRQQLDEATQAMALGDLGPSVGFTARTRVQVRWIVSTTSQEEEEEEEAVWWGATVLGKLSTYHTLPKFEGEEEEEETGGGTGTGLPLERLPVYQVRYDARPPHFPQASLSSVCILDDHHVLDAESNQTLAWRSEGDTWEDDESESEELAAGRSGGGGDDDDDDPVELPPKLKDLYERIAQSERADDEAVGSDSAASSAQRAPVMTVADAEKLARELIENILGSLARKHEQTLSQMPASSKYLIVDGIRDVREKLVKKVAKCLQASGTLSPSDAQEIVNELSAPRRA